MSKLFLSAAVAAILGACAAAAPASVSAAPPHTQTVAEATKDTGVSCAIRATRTAHGLRLEPVATSAKAFAGDYEFTLAKNGGGGSSDVSQGGPFSVEAGRSLTLGASEISLGKDGHLRATLVVRNADGEICRTDYRL